MESKKIKYYTSSSGEKKAINEMNTEYLINALSKKYRTLFESANKNDFSNRLNEINDLKEDLYRRFNEFNETLKED